MKTCKDYDTYTEIIIDFEKYVKIRGKELELKLESIMDLDIISKNEHYNKKEYEELKEQCLKIKKTTISLIDEMETLNINAVKSKKAVCIYMRDYLTHLLNIESKIDYMIYIDSLLEKQKQEH